MSTSSVTHLPSRNCTGENMMQKKSGDDWSERNNDGYNSCAPRRLRLNESNSLQGCSKRRSGRRRGVLVLWLHLRKEELGKMATAVVTVVVVTLVVVAVGLAVVELWSVKPYYISVSDTLDSMIRFWQAAPCAYYYRAHLLSFGWMANNLSCFIPSETGPTNVSITI
ncbi:hypothetical protein K474DRAFT_1773202 [Panus rudis PR-1116 ss-1]|nr:hypothetical protein K474DRAFT_1773202 [Panus rudis PR-1116 ss-1]